MAAVISVLRSRPHVQDSTTSSLWRRGGGDGNALRGATPQFCVILSCRRRNCSIRAFKGGAGTAAPRIGPSEVKHHLTLYDLLGISAEVGIREIKSAYREKARRYHPDANPPSMKEECTKMFLQVQEAYEVLIDPGSRADYDYSLRHPLNMQALKSGMSFRKTRNRTQGSPSETVDIDKQAWRVQWRSQLDGLKRDFHRNNPSPWATAMHRKRQETAAGCQSSSTA